MQSIADQVKALEQKNSDLEDKVRALEEQNASIKEDNQDLRREVHELESAAPDSEKLAAAVHDFMRDQKLITDAARDVPFRIAPTVWRHELETAITEAAS